MHHLNKFAVSVAVLLSVIILMFPSAHADGNEAIKDSTLTDYTDSEQGLDLANQGVQCPQGQLNAGGAALQYLLTNYGSLWTPVMGLSSAQVASNGVSFAAVGTDILVKEVSTGNAASNEVNGNSPCGGGGGPGPSASDIGNAAVSFEEGIALAAGPDNSYATTNCTDGEINQLAIAKLDGDIHVNLSPNYSFPDGSEPNSSVQALMGPHNLAENTPLLGGLTTMIVEIPIQDRQKFGDVLSELRGHAVVHVCGQWVTDIAPDEGWNELHPVSILTIHGMPFQILCDKIGQPSANSLDAIVTCHIKSHPYDSPINLSCTGSCSLNTQVVHRSANDLNVAREGDIGTADFTVTLPGYFGPNYTPPTISGTSDDESNSYFVGQTTVSLNNFVSVSVSLTSVDCGSTSAGTFSGPGGKINGPTGAMCLVAFSHYGAQPGEVLNFDIKIQNKGPDVAPNTIVRAWRDTIPYADSSSTPLVLTSWTGTFSRGTCAGDVCSLGPLSAGESVTIQAQDTVPNNSTHSQCKPLVLRPSLSLNKPTYILLNYGASVNYLTGNNGDDDIQNDAKALPVKTSIPLIIAYSGEICSFNTKSGPILQTNIQVPPLFLAKLQQYFSQQPQIAPYHPPNPLALEAPTRGSLMTTPPQIPTWIHTNAKWWASGTINDIEFERGIEYLINKGVIQLPPTQGGAEQGGASGMPNWVKNNANYWGQGLISDDEFVKGIQYMVGKGIIKLNPLAIQIQNKVMAK